METMKLYYHPDYKTASMYLFYSSKLLAEIAEILGRKEDAVYYSDYAKKVKTVYNRYFIPESGVITEGRQAPQVRALYFDLADEDKKELVAAKLAEMIRENGYKLNTGFLSTPYLLPVLADYGYAKEAFRLLEQEGCPGLALQCKVRSHDDPGELGRFREVPKFLQSLQLRRCLRFPVFLCGRHSG